MWQLSAEQTPLLNNGFCGRSGKDRHSARDHCKPSHGAVGLQFLQEVELSSPEHLQRPQGFCFWPKCGMFNLATIYSRSPTTAQMTPFQPPAKGDPALRPRSLVGGYLSHCVCYLEQPIVYNHLLLLRAMRICE